MTPVTPITPITPISPVARRATAAFATLALVLSACGDDGTDANDGADQAVTLVVYDSFPEPDPGNPLYVALAEFTEQTGIDVTTLVAGDTGTMLAKAELTAGNPEGDVMWGIDNTFLSRAVEAGVFEPYVSPIAADLPFTDLVPDGEATPVDFGDVCVNYDIAALAELGVEPPATFEDLTRPEYAELLIVENPGTSSPGLAFLMGTIAALGDGWEQYWADLRANGVEVVDSWTTAYYDSFSWAGGNRPIVVSYASSPPFEVLAAEEPMAVAPTGVAEETCFRQVEFAGVLAGTDAPDAARELLDFLVSERFQREIPLNLFVFPVDPDAELDPVFVDHAAIPPTSLTLDPAEIDANRADWIDRWTEIVLG